MKNEMPKELTETLLRDVKRYSLNMLAIEMFETPHGGWVKLPDVEAALTAALDADLAERAEVLTKRLRKTEEAGHARHLSKADRLAAADLITALLTANTALRAERDRYLRHLTAGAESLNAYKARAEAAEAKVEKLRGVERTARKLEENLGVKGVNVGSLRVDLYRALAALTTEERK